jgi:hypothetical protein
MPAVPSAGRFSLNSTYSVFYFPVFGLRFTVSRPVLVLFHASKLRLNPVLFPSVLVQSPARFHLFVISVVASL